MNESHSEALKAIAGRAHICWTCGGPPNPDNFGGMCDPCDEKRKGRLGRARKVLESHGRTETQEYRMLRHLGY